MFHGAFFSATYNATNVALQPKKLPVPFSQPANATKCCVASCRKSRITSTFHNVARQVAACNMSSATCNVLQSSSLQVAGKLPRVTWPYVVLVVPRDEVEKIGK